MTLREVSTAFAAALTTVYPEPEAAAIASLVLRHLVGGDSLAYHGQLRNAAAPGIVAQLPGIEARLLAHEPVQYVLGTAYFADMDLEVTPATLIPRPETEELVRLIETEAAGRAGLRVLDVGTGSGCLALALARALPQAEVLAVDISAEALAVARRNGASWAPAVTFQQVDILTEMPALAPATLDILVSNPPYVRESERALMRTNVLAWEPATALFVPDHDPLLFYRRIGELGQVLLKPGGAVYFEINEAFSAETEALLREQGYTSVRGAADMFGRARIVRATAGQ